MQDNKIEKYLNGLLSEEELELFLKQVDEDSSLRESLKLEQEMRLVFNDNDWAITQNSKSVNDSIEKHQQFLQSNKGQEIKNNIASTANDFFKEKKNNYQKAFSLVGTIAAIFILGFFVFKNSFANPDLYYTYKNNWEELPSLTLRGENSNLSEVESLFKDGKFTQALVILNNLPNEKASDPQILLYNGVLNLELNNTQKAIENFQLLQKSDSIDAFKAHWYLALAYIKSDKKESALSELKTLLEKSKTFKNKEAKELIQELE